MISRTAVEYVRSQLAGHVRLFFHERAADLIKGELIRFQPYQDAVTTRERCVLIPIDIPIPSEPESPWTSEFNGTKVTLWNRIPKPDAEGWRGVPDEASPIWWVHDSGTLLPSWNLFGNIFDLLTFGEEKRSTERDQHGRFDWKSSPRAKHGLLEIPAVNEAAALLVAAVTSLSRSESFAFELDDSILKPPVVVLSHDCDSLKGNDLTSQLIRLYRVIQPVTKGRLPKVSNLWWIARNAMSPRRYYFDDATGLLDIERCFGATSTFYMLNGSGGRLGARSPISEAGQFADLVPSSWEVGMHYNYDTYLDHEKFAAQFGQLKQVVTRPIVSGRAHYLRFDPFRSFSFLRGFGIYVDESSGWSDKVAYRNGLAGCFQTYDLEKDAPLDIWEVPLAVMDDGLVGEFGADSVAAIEKHLKHLKCVGGAFTILFHPGNFANPEHPRTLGIYHEILKASHRAEADFLTARSLVDLVRK